MIHYRAVDSIGRLATMSGRRPAGFSVLFLGRNGRHEKRAHLVIALVVFSIPGAALAGTDKTLVSWVILDNTTQQGGSALTIQRGDQFDGIVFGEKASWQMDGRQQLLCAPKATSRPTPSKRPTARR